MKNNYIKKVLKNGVKLYLYIDKNMKKTFVSYSVDYGSSGQWFDFYLDDELYHVPPGCAHFLEHMLGEHSKFGNIYKYFSSKKYEKNGGTSMDRTSYYFIGVDDIKDSIKKLILSIDDPVFTIEDVEETKHAIVEETKRGTNNKKRTALALYYKNLYKDMDLYHSSLNTIGDEKTTRQLDFNTLKACYDAFYYDENKTLLIAGNFDEKKMTDYIESVYRKMRPHKKRLREFEYDNLDKVKTKEEIYYMPTSDDYIVFGFKQKNSQYLNKEIFYYSRFICDMKFSFDSPLIEKLKEKNIISSFEYSSISFLNDTYYDFYVTANVKDSNTFTKEVLKNIRINDFKEEDFRLFIKSTISSQALAIDNKYKRFINFPYKTTYSDDFNDIEFLKSLSFNKFIEYYESLNFDDYSISIVRNINSRTD